MKFVSKIIYFCIFVTIANCDCDKSKKKSTPAKLKEDLLCGYDKTIRPKLNQKNATSVSVKMILKHFTYSTSFQNSASALSVNSWLALVWKDDHLTWTLSDYDSMKSIHISSDSIWTPDISLYNKADQSSSINIFNTVECLIHNSGLVICIIPTKQEALCMADMVRYPFDIQNCSMRFGSWIYSGEEIDLKLNKPPVVTDDFIPNPEWKFLKVEVNKHAGKYNCCPESTYPSLNYNFIIERHIGVEVCMIIVPALVLIILTMGTLCLSPEETERIALICCNVIIHFIYMQYLSWQIPESSDNPPLIMIFGRDSLMLTAFTLVLTVIQRNILKTTKDCPIWIASPVSMIVSSRPGQILFISHSESHGMGKRIRDEESANIIENATDVTNKDWLLFAIILDKMLFTIYCIVYFFMFIAFVP